MNIYTNCEAKQVRDIEVERDTLHTAGLAYSLRAILVAAIGGGVSDETERW